MNFADIIIPVSLPNLFTYFIPEELEESIFIGCRVIVPFGKNKLYTGIVKKIHHLPPKEYQAKGIEHVLDNHPIVLQNQLKLWDWIADYYMANIGDVMQMALPSGFKLVSETKILLSDNIVNFDELNDREFLVVEALQIQQLLSIQEISQILGIKSVQPIIKTLLEKGVIWIEEEVQQKFKAKIEDYISLNYQKFPNPESLQNAFQLIKKSAKQEDALLRLISLPTFNYNDFKIKKSSFCKDYQIDSSTVNQLIKKEILIFEAVTTDRIKNYQGNIQEIPVLSEIQNTALIQIKLGFEEQKPVLLHGVTGSGKTEIYFHLIQNALQQNKQVLYLLPEIALTSQLINRLQKVFGNEVGVYHSKFNIHERVEIWNDLLLPNGKFKIIIGARSALFLPFQNLGLIIVDEEHENTYKQFDPAPRYHARDTAIYLSFTQKIPIILGSATPSIDSYYNAKMGKYALVELNKRYGGISMPEIFCADLSKEKKQKTMHGLFSDLLYKEIEKALENKEQVILFQNRRGYAPILECDVCGHVEKCIRCDVSLTYHKHSNLLRCHYCGHMEELSVTCKACGSVETGFKGSGTEQIEEEFAKFFPNAKIARLDLDTTKKKYAYQEIISDFEDAKIDVLVGTQMITKGLDFNKVSVVGILNADQMLSFPDFRSFERAFQLMLQVAGRAGRRDKRGKVIIQSFQPHHSVIKNVMEYDYLSLYNSEILNRRNFYYPPFYRLICITFKHLNKNVLDAAAEGVSSGLRASLKDFALVLGPEYPAISRINNLYHKKTYIKISKKASITDIKSHIHQWINKLKSDNSYKQVRFNIDVDPQ